MALEVGEAPVRRVEGRAASREQLLREGRISQLERRVQIRHVDPSQDGRVLQRIFRRRIRGGRVLDHDAPVVRDRGILNSTDR